MNQPLDNVLTLALEIAFLAFTGVALISTALSLAHRRLARPFADAISRAPSVWLTLGLLPLVTLSMLLDATGFTPFAALPKLYPLAVIGLAACCHYRQHLNRFTGVLGVLALAGFILPFLNLLELVQRPEMWPLVNPLVPDLYAIQPVVRLLIFGFASVLATGGALLFRGFVWPESRLTEDAPEFRRWAQLLTLLGALALPALVVWDYAILPAGAQSFAALKVGGPLLAVLWLAALLTTAMLLNRHLRRAALVSVLALAGVALETTRQHAIATTAVADRVALVRMTAEQNFTALRQEQETRYPSNTPLDAPATERIYTEKCSTCHAFDKKVVGPAHKDVLPKYRGQPDKLVAFILNPTKVDPAYPPMVAPGLSRREAVAVAEYLLKQLETGGKK